MTRPSIIDKVKFWEEQDKINQALIPRVLEMHDHIKKASLLAQKNSSSYLILSEEKKELNKKFNTLLVDFTNTKKYYSQKIDDTNQNINLLRAQIKPQDTQFNEINSKLTNLASYLDDVHYRVMKADEMMKVINIKKANLFRNWLIVTSIISVLSLSISIYLLSLL